MSSDISGEFDSVYMFMFGGFASELRSNRWHFAKRWARHHPVMLVQPDRREGTRATARPEPRIPGCTLLSVRPPSAAEFWTSSMRIVSELATFMKEAGHRRPLFWFYNPYLTLAFAALPARARVYHATENYFDMELQHGRERLLELIVSSASASDHVIAVSSGVAAAMASRAPRAHVWEMSNGVDLEAYARWKPSARLAALRAERQDIVIYAGNINARIDFELVTTCVARFPQKLFVFVGPVVDLGPADRARWDALQQAPNLRYLGPADPDELPDLYGAADVGFIPYVRTPLIERNGFPLKALEMAATELPVVSTYMAPLEAIRDAIQLTDGHEAFVQALSGARRAAVPGEQRAAMKAACAARDYDRSFEEIGRRLGASLGPGVSTRLDHVTPSMPPDLQLDMLARLHEPCSVSLERCTRMGARALGVRAWQTIPRPVRDILDNPFAKKVEE